MWLSALDTRLSLIFPASAVKFFHLPRPAHGWYLDISLMKRYNPSSPIGEYTGCCSETEAFDQSKNNSAFVMVALRCQTSESQYLGKHHAGYSSID